MTDAAKLGLPESHPHASSDVAGRGDSSGWFGLGLSLAWRGARHPALGVALIRVAWRFRRRGWLRRFPFLPVPATDYLRWRMYTAYGDARAVPPADDVERYARWAVREP